MERSVRLLLTLLALLTGLSAGLAEARVHADAGSGLEQVETGHSGVGVVASTIALGRPQPAPRGGLQRQPGASAVAVAVRVPTIEHGDRALE